MGVIAEGIVAYAQPLIDLSDGSHEGLQRAFSLSQVCFNLALLPPEQREEMIRDMQTQMSLDDNDFATFRRGLLEPMIERHFEMFPRMHQPHSVSPWHMESLGDDSMPNNIPQMGSRPKQAAVVDRYGPCPCNSGKKYKFCCGRKAR